MNLIIPSTNLSVFAIFCENFCRKINYNPPNSHFILYYLDIRRHATEFAAQALINVVNCLNNLNVSTPSKAAQVTDKRFSIETK